MREKREKEIIDAINKISGKYSAYEIFTDWIRCMAISISNGLCQIHDKLWQKREDDYMATIGKYEREEGLLFSEMAGMLVDALEDGPYDVLGEVYMKGEMGSKAAGQFFTPFHISLMTARIAVDPEEMKGNNEILEMEEPSCGGGGMILAAARLLYDAGIDYQKRMKVTAQDLDWKGVYMTYVQLSLLGINAICVQGDTLSEPYDKGKTDRSRILYTPKAMGY